VRAQQALALAEVERAVPVYLAQASWRNPVDGSRRAVQLIGVDSAAGVLEFPGLGPELVADLQSADAVAFDLRSRPEFGPVERLLAERGGPIEVEIGGRRVDVVGLIEIGPSFGADGNVVLSEVNFRRLVKERQVAAVDLVAIKLREGTDLRQAQARLRELLPADVMVMTQAELRAHERRYWEEATPIGFIFAFGSAMGLVVGMVIVYQILFSDIASHLKEYATLKAMGYSGFYLARVVLGAALILAVAGFIPGLLLSFLLYDFVGSATFLPLRLDAAMGITVFLMIFVMCAIAGLLAVRKLRDANPADMF
jgi:putative ABC transport system permease protein